MCRNDVNRDQISPNFSFSWNKSLIDAIVELAATVTFVECRKPNVANEFILNLSKQDCALFCIGRNFNRVNIREGIDECFCSNGTLIKPEQTNFEPSTKSCFNSDVIYLSYQLSVRHYPKVVASTNSLTFLGCVKNNISHANFTRTKNAEGFITCESKCAVLEHTLAIEVKRRNSSSESECFCAKTFVDILTLLDTEKLTKQEPAWMGQSQKCVFGSVYVTDWGITSCIKSDFLDPENPIVPQIGFVTIPGSGNTWIRFLFEKLTGVLSGSVYFAGDIYRKGLKGEREKYQTRRTSMVKTHEGNQHKGSQF